MIKTPALLDVSRFNSALFLIQAQGRYLPDGDATTALVLTHFIDDDCICWRKVDLVVVVVV